MRSIRALLILILIATLAAAGYLTLRGFDLLGAPALAQAKDVPAGHQEIAFLIPASSGETWERLVAALDALARDWQEQHPQAPAVRVNKDHAFARLTTDVAEVSLWLEGFEEAQLWIRWYKLSSAVPARRWLEELSQRSPPPLAIVGGDTSDRAVSQGHVLRELRGRWRGADPLYLITTATADRYNPTGAANQEPVADRWPVLMELYQGRSFRFSFANEDMAEVVLDFLRWHPQVWPHGPRDIAGHAAVVTQADALSVLTAAAADVTRPHVLHSLRWMDDRYSLDLAARFDRAFPAVFPHAKTNPNSILYSTGDSFHPNPREALAVALLLRDAAELDSVPAGEQHARIFPSTDAPAEAGAALPNPALRSGASDPRELLLLPTAALRAQRFLRTLVRHDPLRARNLLVVSGDSISFNNVYRDRNLLWNVQDVPMPLLFFCHRNPVNESAGFRPIGPGPLSASCSATDDLLLHRDILEVLVQAGYRGGSLTADADALLERLRAARWRAGRIVVPGFAPALEKKDAALPFLFESNGNRRDRTGEHVVLVQPRTKPAALAQSEIGVWRWQSSGGPDNGWVQVRRLAEVTYGGGPAVPAD